MGVGRSAGQIVPKWASLLRPTMLEAHPRSTLLSDFILGSQDGIINVLGIILGLWAAGSSERLIIVAALAALGAESVAMAAVAFSSTLARRRLYLSEVEREKREMVEVPEAERAEVREILVNWGYQGDDLDLMLDKICSNPKAMLEFMMSFELRLAPVPAHQPRKSAWVVGAATVLGHAIPIVPFFFVGSNVTLGASLSIVLSAAALYGIGWYEAKITAGIWWRRGLQMLLIGLAGGLVGYAVGVLVGAFP